MDIGKVFKNYQEIILDPHKNRPEISKKGAWVLSMISAIPLGIPHIISAINLNRSKNPDEAPKFNATQARIKQIFARSLKPETKAEDYRREPYVAKLSSLKPPQKLATEIIDSLHEFSKLNPIGDAHIPDLWGMISSKLSNINSNLSVICKDPEALKILEANKDAKSILDFHHKMENLIPILLKQVRVQGKTVEQRLNDVYAILEENKISLQFFINDKTILNKLFESKTMQRVIYLYINKSKKTIEESSQIEALNDKLINYNFDKLINMIGTKKAFNIPMDSIQLTLLVKEFITPHTAQEFLDNPTVSDSLKTNQELLNCLSEISKYEKLKSITPEIPNLKGADNLTERDAKKIARDDVQAQLMELGALFNYSGKLEDFLKFKKQKLFELAVDKGGDPIIYNRYLVFIKLVESGVYPVYLSEYRKINPSSIGAYKYEEENIAGQTQEQGPVDHPPGVDELD